MNCPRCGLPVPANESAAYSGRHEDCSSISKLPPVVFQPSKGVIVSTSGAALGHHRRTNRSGRRS